MNDFLPKSYEVPQGKGNYVKFQNGENRFRILTSPILGWEYWVSDEDGNRKPLRRKMDDPFKTDVATEPEKIKHFWAMVVYNYQDKKIQILEITQKGIQKSLRALAKDEDWGSPVNNYDVVITKTGEKLETEYQTQPKPAKKTDPKIVEEFEKIIIDLKALYSGGDPFQSEKVDPDSVPL